MTGPSTPEPFPDLPPPDFAARRERVLEVLGEGAMVLPAAPPRLRSRDVEHPYRPDSELVWLTGAREPGTVAVLLGGDEGRFVLFARERDPSAELWTGPRLGPEAAGERHGADECHPLAELEERLPELVAEPRTLHYRPGADARVDRLVLSALATARTRGARKGNGPRALVDPGEILDELRLRKDPAELARHRRAAAVTVDAFRRAMEATRPGRGEWELEALLDGTFRGAGADGPAYETIVGSGANACVLHYVANADRMGAGDLVLVDAGAAVDLYAADVTRTWSVSGSFSAEQRAVYDVVEAARGAGVAAVRPGATAADVHDAATLRLVEGLVELGVLEGDPEELVEDEAHKPYFPHSTSHWLGLDVHDPGDYARDGRSRVLEPGMVLTVEPGLYFPPDPPPEAEGDDGRDRAAPYRGIGVRVEDDVLVTDGGHEVLTAGLPTAADEVESLVGGGS